MTQFRLLSASNSDRRKKRAKIIELVPSGISRIGRPSEGALTTFPQTRDSPAWRQSVKLANSAAGFSDSAVRRRPERATVAIRATTSAFHARNASNPTRDATHPGSIAVAMAPTRTWHRQHPR